MELKVTQSSLPRTIFNSCPVFLKQFTLPAARRWKLHSQRISCGQDISTKILGHVVKENECAATDKNIIDVNLVFGGQYLHIPAGLAQVCHFEGDKLPKTIPTFGLHSRQWNQLFTVPSSSPLRLAKTTGSFLVLVPLIAFCIRCIISVLQNRVARNLRHQAANKSRVHHRRSINMRWKTVLSDLTDPEALDAESEPNSEPFLEDHEQLHSEDASHAYSKLEDDYQKFLSECGMSKWGYWRGGSPQ